MFYQGVGQASWIHTPRQQKHIEAISDALANMTCGKCYFGASLGSLAMEGAQEIHVTRAETHPNATNKWGEQQVAAHNGFTVKARLLTAAQARSASPASRAAASSAPACSMTGGRRCIRGMHELVCIISMA